MVSRIEEEIAKWIASPAVPPSSWLSRNSASLPQAAQWPLTPSLMTSQFAHRTAFVRRTRSAWSQGCVFMVPHPPVFRFAHTIRKFIAKLLTAKAFILEQFPLDSARREPWDVEKTCAGYPMELRKRTTRLCLHSGSAQSSEPDVSNAGE